MISTVDLLSRRLAKAPVDRTALLALADALTEDGGDGRGYQALAVGGFVPLSFRSRVPRYVWYNSAVTHDDQSEDLPQDWFRRLWVPSTGSASPLSTCFYENRCLFAALEAAAAAFLRLPPSRQALYLKRRRPRTSSHPWSTSR